MALLKVGQLYKLRKHILPGQIGFWTRSENEEYTTSVFHIVSEKTTIYALFLKYKEFKNSAILCEILVKNKIYFVSQFDLIDDTSKF